jgi:hypothetical protein
MFCVNRVVNLYVLGATSFTTTYMFQNEELAEELFTTEKKQRYITVQIVNKVTNPCNLFNKVKLANIACLEEHGRIT